MSKWHQRNKEKHNLLNRTWKKNNPEKVKEQRLKDKERRKEWYKKLKFEGCVKCGENRIVCLDFHHRDPNKKEFSVSGMLWTHSKKRILEEIAKCDILCANCHRIEHENDNGTEEIQEEQSFVHSFEI